MNWLKANAISLGIVLAVVPLLVGSLVWVDGRYAYAADVRQYQADTEQTLILIQLSNLEERQWRELKNPINKQDRALLYRLNQQIKKLEVRYEALIKDGD